MSPAGDFPCLSAALKAGADAVYFGAKGFNMRAGARNFSLRELPKAAALCHSFGAKAYLTLNTIFYQRELRKLDAAVRAAAKAGIDAVIAWDFAVFELAKKYGLEVFLSTQASVSNAAAVCKYYREFGVRRFVLARECSISDIAAIRRAVRRELGAGAGIQFEVFAHGAMCVSQSGRCFMSAFSRGASANRGECLQPCRREYTISAANGDSFAIGSGYVLSPKDLCVAPFIEKLFEAGVDSLKIEGRNRNAEYVWTATRAYKKLRDFYFSERGKPGFGAEFAKLKSWAVGELSKVFNRGFSGGFYMGKPAGDWTSAGNEAKLKKRIVGHVVKFYPRISVAEISVDAEPFSAGDILQAEGEKTGFVEFAAESVELGGERVKTAPKGSLVGVKVPEKLRRLDRIYKLC